MSEPIDVDAILGRFREWLDRARDEAMDGTHPADAGPTDEGPPREFGLIDLVAEFTALRQELKLQTRSARGLQEQAEALLPPLRQAIEHFRSVAPREEQAAWTAGKPLADGLAMLDEALDRVRGEIEKARHALLDRSVLELEGSLDELFKGQSWWRRRRLRRYHEQVLETVARWNRGDRRRWFDSLLEGFGLMQNRLRRVMQAEAVERIDCLGRPVDPERMVVVEVVDDPGVPSHTVVEEIRRGYLWRGRVLRLAEVRASRGEPEPAGSTVERHEDVAETDGRGDSAMNEDNGWAGPGDGEIEPGRLGID
jgi:molecular chaperone GrpE